MNPSNGKSSISMSYGMPGRGRTGQMPGSMGMGGHYGMNGWGGTSAMLNPASFEPSKSIRDCIGERMDEQSKLLQKAQERLDGLVKIALDGRAAGMKGVGDQQIGGELVEKIIASAGRPDGTRDKALEKMYWGGRTPRSGSSRLQTTHPRHPVAMAARFRDRDVYSDSVIEASLSPEEKKKRTRRMEKVDPMQRYQQLETEIQALLVYAGMLDGHGKDHPDNAMLVKAALMATMPVPTMAQAD
ncbi:hypothetical protein LTR08_004062 [Meristemomyces frigidus]|nr:hypothetical protein LTR08_004062 [Meristemomyces frigidus]